MRSEIDLSAIRENLNKIEQATGNPLVLMVKADAYGHGLLRVVRGVPCALYGVATEEEGELVRGQGGEALVTAPSLRDLPLAKRYDMIPLIGDPTLAKRAIEVGLKRCHLKVNSGMNRFGIRGEKGCYRIANALLRGGVRIEGIATHYLEEKDGTILRQNEAFDACVRAVKCAVAEWGGREPMTHVTGSGALYAAGYDRLRVGLAAYGYHAGYTAGIPLKKAMKVTSEVLAVKTISRGDTLGYGGCYRAKKRVTVCTVQGGYGDGVTREEIGRAVLLRGRRERIAAVCMDSFELVAEHTNPRVGDKVTILSEGLDAAYIAAYRKSIPYTVLLGYDVPRVKRVYAE